MFEHHQKEMEALNESNAEFSHLLKNHRELDRQIEEAQDGSVWMDDIELHRLKKEKLFVKDRLSRIMQRYLT